ncbi:hypothetical protein [Synechococcus sp. GFB01]|jgi:hypothetical protein|uniref:hypothetical protein n=1 Tax=Synechococcus sp. GFB01 TaxID=1662190 RepID=UPI00069D4D05|nr:hypothetical protein [Synechococcus sp. GFB01]
MSTTTLERPAVLLAAPRSEPRQQRQSADAAGARGFSSTSAGKRRKSKAGSKRSHAISKADWGPLGKHPDLDAIVARQRLHLPLSGRLSEAQVNQAWKRCAGEHHPDRGGEHSTMQLVNGARDLLLGRSLS